jgi:hypothetical protein
MLGRSCPTCGLTVGRDAYEHEGVLVCCRGCAERTFCACRVSVATGARGEQHAVRGAGQTEQALGHSNEHHLRVGVLP